MIYWIAWIDMAEDTCKSNLQYCFPCIWRISNLKKKHIRNTRTVPGVCDVRESRFGLHVCHGRILWKAHGVTQSATALRIRLGCSETKWETREQEDGGRGFSIMMSYDMSTSNGWQPDVWLEFLYHNVTLCTLHISVHAFLRIAP